MAIDEAIDEMLLAAGVELAACEEEGVVVPEHAQMNNGNMPATNSILINITPTVAGTRRSQ